ncbi:Zinc knuckle CX2CX4HX4C [Artemisia annua]|uniref:Zinc knuckle CX2CX4HX4C n=1 Tax=Artemisia annua TaxID=35608 RepID=A0A2U1P3M2_ARTAN|nr:Zinc knuckle CX2CX4HX4C [Artemisia annua]
MRGVVWVGIFLFTMSEQEPKPRNPNELTSPPPVVNPPSSRSDKNLKTKKTTRTMNPKPASTMKHHDMLSKSTDVNFKKVMTRSSSKGSEAGMGIEEMDCGDEAGISTVGRNDSSDVSGDATGMNGVVNEDVGVEKIEAVKGSEVKDGVVGNKANGNVSDMFPELISTKVSKVNVDKLPDIPVPFEQNPVLNLECAENNGVKSSLDVNKTVNANVPGSNNGFVGVKGSLPNTSCSVNEIGESSSTKDSEMKDASETGKPLLFSNVVQGTKYLGGNKLKLVPCTIMDGRAVGSGRASYARILVEVDAAKGMVDSVEIWYRKLNRSMKLKVEYAWQPPICSHCCVFGHSLDKCSNKVASDKDKTVTNDTKVQSANKMNEVPKNSEECQYVDYRKNNRYYGEQRSYFEHGNRFDVLASSEDGEKSNDWQGVKINIDVACEMGIPFDEDEVGKWHLDLQEYYKKRCAAMKNSDKRDLLFNKIRILMGDINTSKANIEQNCHKIASEAVVFEMESTGTSREQAFGVAKNSIWSVIQRLVWGASVYFIWQERNMRLFGTYSRTEDELFKIIVDSVRFRIMSLKVKVTADVLDAAECWCLPIDKKLKYRIFLKGIWLMVYSGKGFCNKVNHWIVSLCAGSLLLVEVCGPVEVIDEGLWPNCCSCDSIGFERSYSFSLFIFLPKWFYMIRFFKEKTFIIVAAITVYVVNLHSAIMDEVTGLDSSGIWLWCEDVLLYQNSCLLMMLDVLVTDCMVSPIPLVVAVCFLLVFSYGDVWVFIGWSLCITPCIQSLSLARGKAVRTAIYYGLGCLGILLSVYCSVFDHFGFVQTDMFFDSIGKCGDA